MTIDVFQEMLKYINIQTVSGCFVILTLVKRHSSISTKYYLSISVLTGVVLCCLMTFSKITNVITPVIEGALSGTFTSLAFKALEINVKRK